MMKIKKWSMVVNARTIMIVTLPDGKFLAVDSANDCDQNPTSRFSDIREDVFTTIADCCIFLGYPIGILPVPILT